MGNKNALGMYFQKYDLRPAEVARQLGITRQSVYQKLTTDLYKMSLETYREVAKIRGIKTEEVVTEVLTIDRNKKALDDLLR